MQPASAKALGHADLFVPFSAILTGHIAQGLSAISFTLCNVLLSNIVLLNLILLLVCNYIIFVFCRKIS